MFSFSDLKVRVFNHHLACNLLPFHLHFLRTGLTLLPFFSSLNRLLLFCKSTKELGLVDFHAVFVLQMKSVELESFVHSLYFNSISSVAKHLESANTMFSFIWWIIGFYWVSTGGQALALGSPQLYWSVPSLPFLFSYGLRKCCFNSLLTSPTCLCFAGCV